ncbi:MAG: metallophosphoesterase family protein [Opitutaceae bacterium]|nr:metallophosphoesterase family protein [Opitutaceae bacterium]
MIPIAHPTAALRLLALVPLALAPLAAQQVVRGPYLQIGTPNSIVVRWRTDVPTDSAVKFGAEPGRLDREVKTKWKTTEHIVPLEGLTPSTKYHYAIGNAEKMLAGGDAGHAFITSPQHGTRQPIRTWVIGDAGTASAKGNEGLQAKVRDAYYNFTGVRPTDVFLQLGDNAYSTGTDAEYQIAVFDMYKDILRKVVTWPTLGNHDAGSAMSVTQSGVYYDIFTLPTLGQAGGLMSGTEAYYAFDYGNIHYICLDSHYTDRSPTGAMFTWLKNDLASTKQDWIVVYFHHPPYTKGSHDSNTERNLVEMRTNALPIMEAGGVDLCLTGHSHSYERSFLLDGHYGTQDTLTAKMKLDAGDGKMDGTGPYKKATLGTGVHEGAVYVVAGSSGKVSGKNEKSAARGFLDHPAMLVSLAKLGSFVIDVDNNKLDATFLSETGERLDYFTMVKGANGKSTNRTTALPAKGAAVSQR